MIRSVIKGVGTALPTRVMTNADISKIVDTSHEWIVERTGIHARHIAGEGETTRSLAVAASRNALDDAGMTAADIDLVVLATSTPDNTFPATATMVQADLGITRGAAFDLQAVCSGFIYALSTADALIRTGQAKGVLVIGSETFSRILDWTDRATCVLFGDGAGAFVLSAELGQGITMTKVFYETRCALMAAIKINFMLMAGHRQQRQLGTCGWRDVKCSSTPSPTLLRLSMKF